METTQFDPIVDVCARIDFARRLFCADVDAMPEDLLSATSGGASRCGFDLIFELSGMYHTFAGLLSAGDGTISGPKGWVRAPLDFRRKDDALSGLQSAFDAFTNALKSYAGNVLTDEFSSPVGPLTPLAMANLAAWHTMYHSGQLNYIQTIHGDESFHWM